MEQETKRCPYCGEEILAIAKKCKHCGEWLQTEPLEAIGSGRTDYVEEADEPYEEETEELSIREKVCRFIGWAFYALATLDLSLANLCDIDITGFRYSPLLFSAIGYLISHYGGNISDDDEDED